MAWRERLDGVRRGVRYRWTFAWLRDGRPCGEDTWVSFSDSRKIADIEIRRVNRPYVENGFAPVILLRDTLNSPV